MPIGSETKLPTASRLDFALSFPVAMRYLNCFCLPDADLPPELSKTGRSR